MMDTEEVINEFLAVLFRRLEEENLDYAILRNYNVRSLGKNKDLDLLINPKQLQKVHKIVRKTSRKFKIEWKVRDQIRNRRYLLMFETKKIFVLDLGKYITVKMNSFEKKTPFFGTKIYLNQLKVKAFRQDDMSFRILELDNELLLLANHSLIKPKAKYISYLEDKAPSIGLSFKYKDKHDLLRMIFALMQRLQMRKESYVRQVIAFPIYLFKYFIYEKK